LARQTRYSAIIERIFRAKYRRGARVIDFRREDLTEAANELGIKLPANLGDVLYSFRFREALPNVIKRTAPAGYAWLIRLAGRSKYRFVLEKDQPLAPRSLVQPTKVPDATPGIIEKWALTDEQALLAKIRYNRLLDIFTGITCYSLQNHLRTTVREIGQIETDELYVGVDKRGVQYVLPVQAKGTKERLSIVQIEQDFALCGEKFPALVPRAIACQFMADKVIVLFQFEATAEGASLISEKHYKLVPPEEVTAEDLALYGERPQE
jgi:hypothetical protein